jgi:hypothetical protein
MANRLFSKETVLYLVLFAALTAVFFTLPPLGLHSNEEGVKFIQMKNFALNGSLSIPYPAQELGFGAGDLVGGYGFLESRGGTLRAVTPPLFPLLASVFYPLFGDRVVHFLPLLFLFFAIIFLEKTLALIMERGLRTYLLLLAFLASPVFMHIFGFSAVFAALFLETVSLYLLVRYYRVSPSLTCLFGSSFALGSTLFFDPRWILLVMVWTLCGALLLSRRKKAREAAIFVAGAVAAVALWAVSEALLYHTFPSLYLRFMIPFHALLSKRILVILAALLVSAALLLLAEKRSLASSLKSTTWFVVMLLFIGTLLAFSTRMPVIAFILPFPVLLFIFYGLSGRLDEFREGKGALGIFLTAVALLYLVLGLTMQLTKLPLFPYVLPSLIPLVVVIMGLEQKRIFEKRAMVIHLVIAIAIAVSGGYDQAKNDFIKYTNYNAKRVAFIEEATAKGDVVVFKDSPSMEHAGPLFFDRIYLLAQQAGHFEKILKTLKDRGMSHAYLWSADLSDVSRWGNPYDKGTYRAFPMPSSCRSSCNNSFYLIRVGVDAALGKLSRVEEGKRDAEGG